MKKQILAFVALFLLLSWISFAQENFPDPLTLPPLTQLVTDYSNVFDTNTLSGLNEKALTLEKQTSAQVAAVLFPHRQGNELFDIGMRLFRESGIGQEGKNNGILLLIATDEKKLRIIVGYGLEGTVPDIAASNLIENTLRPLVDEWRRAEAIEAYDDGIGVLLAGEWTSESPTNQYQSSPWDSLTFLIWFVLMIRSFSQIKKKKATKQVKRWPVRLFGALLLIIILSLPGLLGAFFGYIAGLFIGIFMFAPHTPWMGGIWFGGWGRGSGWFGWGGFGGFGGGSSWGGGAGD